MTALEAAAIGGAVVFCERSVAMAARVGATAFRVAPSDDASVALWPSVQPPTSQSVS